MNIYYEIEKMFLFILHLFDKMIIPQGYGSEYKI